MKKEIAKIRQHIKDDVQLIIVTKNQSSKEIREIYSYGELNFGENKVQELLKKQKELPKDINWHFIGNLQTNKVKLIAPFVHLIQSVDSIKLLQKINKYAGVNNRKIDCLIQIKISKDTNKSGFSQKEALELFQTQYEHDFPNISLKGIMCIGTLTNDISITINEFQAMKNISCRIPIKKPILSMGMSKDYRIACQEGSNMIRIGSGVFQ